MPKSTILFNNKCEAERWKEIEKRREKEIKQEIVTTHGSSGVLLVLLHPGLLSGGSPQVILMVAPPISSPCAGYPQRHIPNLYVNSHAKRGWVCPVYAASKISGGFGGSWWPQMPYVP